MNTLSVSRTTATPEAVRLAACTRTTASSVKPLLPVRPVRKTSVSFRIHASNNAPSTSATEVSGTRVAAEIPKLESIEDLMAFSGALPERVNGRLAMLGFVAAVGAELTTGQSAFTQFANHPISVPFHWALFAVASAMPAVMSGNSLNTIMEASKESGMAEGMKRWNADVELMNGRAAMIGFASLLIVEGIKGQALF